MTPHQDTNTERNCRVQERYDELMQAGKHGHYESMFRVVREEVDAAISSRDEAAQQPQGPSEEDVRELSKWLNEEVSAPINRQALARVLAVQQPQGQAGYEHEMALMEAHRNAEEVAYFEARPSRDEVNARHVFGAAFLRGWRASNKSHPVPQGQAVSDERVEELAAQFDISVSAVRAILSLRDKSVVKESLTTERVPLSDERLDYMMREAFEKAYCAYYPVTAQTNRDVFERDSLGDYIRVNVQSGWTMWQAALTQPQAQQPQERDPSGIYQMYGAFVACVAGARIPGTYQSWLGARLALALPDDVLIDLRNKAAPNDIPDSAVFGAYQEHQQPQTQQAAAVPAARILLLGGVKQVVLTDQGFDLPIGSNLYAAPPSPVLPLSEVDIERGREEFGGERHDFMAGVRFAEKSHGITAHGAGGESGI